MKLSSARIDRNVDEDFMKRTKKPTGSVMLSSLNSTTTTTTTTTSLSTITSSVKSQLVRTVVLQSQPQQQIPDKIPIKPINLVKLSPLTILTSDPGTTTESASISETPTKTIEPITIISTARASLTANSRSLSPTTRRTSSQNPPPEPLGGRRRSSTAANASTIIPPPRASFSSSPQHRRVSSGGRSMLAGTPIPFLGLGGARSSFGEDNITSTSNANDNNNSSSSELPRKESIPIILIVPRGSNLESSSTDCSDSTCSPRNSEISLDEQDSTNFNKTIIQEENEEVRVEDGDEELKEILQEMVRGSRATTNETVKSNTSSSSSNSKRKNQRRKQTSKSVNWADIVAEAPLATVVIDYTEGTYSDADMALRRKKSGGLFCM